MDSRTRRFIITAGVVLAVVVALVVWGLNSRDDSGSADTSYNTGAQQTPDPETPDASGGNEGDTGDGDSYPDWMPPKPESPQPIQDDNHDHEHNEEGMVPDDYGDFKPNPERSEYAAPTLYQDDGAQDAAIPDWYEFASDFTEAFTDYKKSDQEWHKSLEPYMSPELHALYEGVPAQGPGAEPYGRIEVVSDDKAGNVTFEVYSKSDGTIMWTSVAQYFGPEWGWRIIEMR